MSNYDLDNFARRVFLHFTDFFLTYSKTKGLIPFFFYADKETGKMEMRQARNKVSKETRER